jgi:asparagine synthase (glutamine-hydrolysing)
MCGILAYVENKKKLSEKLKDYLNLLNHRGPDDHGWQIFDNAMIGQTRLAIIDLEKGKQPMTSEDGRYSITFNGEIYNYKNLRIELERNGYHFNTNSDTEVILAGFIKHGIQFAQRLRGMFAFAIWDNNMKEIWVARDSFGIKPLYYTLSENYFAVASELHVLKSDQLTINSSILHYYFQVGFIPSPFTIYNEIYKLKPGHFIKFSFKNKNLVESEFEADKIFSRSKSENLSTKKTWNAILESVDSHLVSDVPFGAFLSGGIDSTIIVLAMKEILGSNFQTFSIGFEDSNYDESNYIQEVIEKLQLTNDLYILRNEEWGVDLIESIINNFGEPFGDSSIIPTYFVSKLASKKVKMVLSGDGGDELFAGYPFYFNWLKNSPKNYLYGKLRNREYAKFIKGIGAYSKRFLTRESSNDLNELIDKFSLLNNNDLKKLLKNTKTKIITSFEENAILYNHESRLDFALVMDLTTNLPGHLLPKVDITSMMNGLEVRTPLIDKNLYNLVRKLKKSDLYDISQKIPGKKILKEILSQNFSQEFLYRKKQGFSIPLNHLFEKNTLGHRYIVEFCESSFFRQYFNLDYVLDKLNKHNNKNENNSSFLFNLLTMAIWHKNNMNEVA